MAKKLQQIFSPTDEIEQTFTINAWHVSQSVDALTGAEDYDITISGSLTLTGSAYWIGDEDAGGVTVDHVVIDQTTGKLYTTGSVGAVDGTSGTSGVGTPGTSGTSGGPGTPGTPGTSGTSGVGTPGTSGTSGDSGTSGTSGAGGSTSPGGSNTHVQFNDNGTFGGESGFVYNKTSDTVTITSISDSTPGLVMATTETTPVDGDVLGEIEGYTTQHSTNLGGIRWVGAGNFTGGFYPSRLEFQTVETNTPATQLTIKHTGRLVFHDYTSAILKSVNGQVEEYSGTEYYLPRHSQGGANLEDSLIYSSGVNSQVVVGDGTPALLNQGNGLFKVSGSINSVSIYATDNIVAYSDARSKTNIETIPDALDKIDAIRGVTYNKIDNPDGDRYMGVIAQELQEVLPEVVSEDEDGSLAVAYGNITGVLIQAVKELRAEIKELKANK